MLDLISCFPFVAFCYDLHIFTWLTELLLFSQPMALVSLLHLSLALQRSRARPSIKLCPRLLSHEYMIETTCQKRGRVYHLINRQRMDRVNPQR